jgi:hypothetical protein
MTAAMGVWPSSDLVSSRDRGMHLRRSRSRSDGAAIAQLGGFSGDVPI